MKIVQLSAKIVQMGFTGMEPIVSLATMNILIV